MYGTTTLAFIICLLLEGMIICVAVFIAVVESALNNKDKAKNFRPRKTIVISLTCILVFALCLRGFCFFFTGVLQLAEGDAVTDLETIGEILPQKDGSYIVKYDSKNIYSINILSKEDELTTESIPSYNIRIFDSGIETPHLVKVTATRTWMECFTSSEISYHAYIPVKSD